MVLRELATKSLFRALVVKFRAREIESTRPADKGLSTLKNGRTANSYEDDCSGIPPLGVP